jgi:hypothetical protein
VNVAANSVRSAARKESAAAALARIVRTPRFAVYLACTVIALVTNVLLGKETMWDTLNYHLYAGFSALHDRFGTDYFPAGPQSYFNPYAYVPFYLLVMSKLPAIWVASILAIAQSGILWLTYELTLEVTSEDQPRTRIAVGVCAAALAFANPILIGELGSSYADITTAEIVLAGWLLLLRATRSPSWVRLLGAGVLLGAVSALKLTNAAHALAAATLVMFFPGSMRVRLRSLAVLAVAMGIGFAAVATPWTIRLQHQFGNPFFPLLNGFFRSPQYSPEAVLDYRFIPDSIAKALWRPFEIMSAAPMVDNEGPSPDLRYALLLILGAAVLAYWVWRRWRGSADVVAVPKAQRPAWYGLAALACAFLVDWILWLRASGNGRYFIGMGCVAAVLVAALVFRLLARQTKVRNYLLVGIFLAQGTQLALGAEFRYSAWWDGGPWFQVSMPKVPSSASLYFAWGNPANAFIAPFLPKGSGLVNIGGDYELGPGGASGETMRRLIQKYGPSLRVIMFDWNKHPEGTFNRALFVDANDALRPFGLQALPHGCNNITVADIKGSSVVPAVELRGFPHYPDYSRLYLVTCPVVIAPSRRDPRLVAERAAADAVFDHLEEACPKLFRPRGAVTRNYSTAHEQVWMRRYAATSLAAIVGPTYLLIKSDDRPGAPDFLGRESDWVRAPQPLACGRGDERYWAKLLPRSP